MFTSDQACLVGGERSSVASALPRPRALQGDRLSMGIDSMDDITAPPLNALAHFRVLQGGAAQAATGTVSTEMNIGRAGHTAALAALLEAPGVDPSLCNDKLQSPLHFAAFKKQPEAATLLLAHPACDPFVLDRKEPNPNSKPTLNPNPNLNPKP